MEELEALGRDRAVPPSPAQLRVVADLIEQGQAAATGDGTAQGRTNDNPAPGTNEPDAPAMVGEPAHGVGTNEPTTAASRTNETAARGKDGPRHLAPPLPATRTNEPAPAPGRLLNRRQRRRPAALARRGLRPAA
jgi:hypothetical protein